MDEPQFVEKADPDEVFGLLSDETRIDILRALWDQQGETVPFSDLREAVGVRDSGQFNYHLDKLVGRFVTRTDEGYELAYAGRQVIGALEAGAYTMEGSVDPIDLSEPCLTCGGNRQLRYEDEMVDVNCDTCPVTSQYGVPPSVFAGTDREAIPAVAGEYLLTICQHLERGFCWQCDGPVETSVEPIGIHEENIPEDVDAKLPDGIDAVPVVKYTCPRCGAGFTGGLRMMLLSHPAVAGFHHDHGIDLSGEHLWQLATFSIDDERIRSDDPFRASATYTGEGEEITVVVDDGFDVVDIEHA